jgi:hypothetical protein
VNNTSAKYLESSNDFTCFLPAKCMGRIIAIVSYPAAVVNLINVPHESNCYDTMNNGPENDGSIILP